jgi:hypothetical protein
VDSIFTYCDADFAGDIETRKSTTAYVLMMSGGAVSWRSTLQPTVVLSTSEAEYMAAAAATREVLWFRKLLAAFGVNKTVLTIRSDSQSALALIQNPIVSQRSKHIDVMNYFKRERFERGEVGFEYCTAESMVADNLTKVVGTDKFVWCRREMGVVNSSET